MDFRPLLEHQYLKWFLAMVVFVVTFYSRALFVDTYYQYSFEADSEACVSVSKSFYNFFKRPCKETVPYTLSDYPPYQSGDFIFAALTANVVRPLVKAGVVKADIGDGDNSIVIFAMRWNSVIYQSVMAVLVFLIAAFISGSSFFSFLLVLLYYILSPQILDFDLTRIDHYYFFSAGLVVYFTIQLFQAPSKVLNYVLLGISCAMVMATKLNFPFYLVIVLFTLIYLIYTKKLSWKNFFIAFGFFLLMWLFLFQRWIFYPEEVLSTINGIWQTGDDWVTFWGIKPYLFYHYHQFFSEGYSLKVVLLLVGWLIAFFITVWYAIKQKDAMAKMLILTFIAQSLMLMIVPKVGRYGTVIPIWLCICFAYAARFILTKYRSQYIFLLLVFLLPNAIYAYGHFKGHHKQWDKVKPSIEATRIAVKEWLETNVKPGSVVAVYHPRISNPPIMEMPITAREKDLYYPFLFDDKASNFQPLSTRQLERKINYVILNNHYYNFHFWLLDNLIESGLENADVTKGQWQAFYDSLDVIYDHVKFEAVDKNYGIRWYKIYTIDSVPKNEPLGVTIKGIQKEDKNCVFNVELSKAVRIGGLEIQISTDPTFRWVDYASMDGFSSKYREDMISVINCIPAEVDTLIENGILEELGVAERVEKVDINSAFADVIDEYENGCDSLGQCLNAYMKTEYKPKFYELLGHAYGFDKDYKSFSFEQFKELLGYKKNTVKKLHQVKVSIPLKLLSKDNQNYFRIRVKLKHVVYSDWVIGEIN